jgi:hypothetical protein
MMGGGLCDGINLFILSHSTFSLYSIALHTIEARNAGILRKTGTKVCASLCGSVAQETFAKAARWYEFCFIIDETILML